MSTPLIIAHRGASAVAPENTIAAFQAAIDAGADGIEFDVRLSRDGVPVVIHDETLNRTHGMRRRVGEMTLDELNDVDVPSVEQLFKLFESNKLILYLELKETQIELVEACCRLIDEYKFKERVIVECFELSALKMIDPAVKTVALFHSHDAFIIERAKEVGASVLALHHRITTVPLIDEAKLAGFNVVVWTVDERGWVSRARAHGVHALITNNPSALIAARDHI
ncbi:MAG TPA: glycerophosphodiester phosphodiesterase family protein [Pyrinomonadaceae bacterium]|nr:glycerophosphodiester phosphodiesterase family protein [Pyrinomonadaceae bacterium]